MEKNELRINYGKLNHLPINSRLPRGTMDVTIWLSIATATFAVVAIVSVAYAVARSNYAKATIELQSQNIQALFDKQKIQENQIKELQMRNAKLEGELKSFKTVPLAQIAKMQTQTYEIISEGAKIVMTIAENQRDIMQEMNIRHKEYNKEV